MNTPLDIFSKFQFGDLFLPLCTINGVPNWKFENMACGVSIYWEIQQEIQWECQKNFWCAPTPSIHFTLFVITAWKWTSCIVDLELLRQLVLLIGLKMEKIAWPSHGKLNLAGQFYSNRTLKFPLQSPYQANLTWPWFENSYVNTPFSFSFWYSDTQSIQ